MHGPAPLRPRGCDPLGGAVKYRHTVAKGNAHPRPVGAASGRLGPSRYALAPAAAPTFAAWLAGLPWYAWMAMFGALCIGALAGGLYAWHDAERSLYLGQSPARASIRARIARLRSHFARMRADDHRRAPDIWGELRGLESDLRDLAPPSARVADERAL
ncbi:MAG: hypothetical protein AMXMBFR55_33130 [Gemmatimonadota bacterium]